MNEEIRILLDNEIKSQIEGMSTFNTGSEEKERAAECIVKLYKLRSEDEKMDNEKTKAIEQSKEKWFKVGIVATETIVPLIFYGMWMKRGLKFEETGTFTSQTFRGLISRFKPTKK